MLLQIELPTHQVQPSSCQICIAILRNCFDFDSRSIRSKNGLFQAITRCSLASCQAASEFPRSASVIRFLGLRSEEHTSELQSLTNLVCRLLLEKKKLKTNEDVF